MVGREVLVTRYLFCKTTENNRVRNTQNYIWSHSPELLEVLRGHGAKVTPGMYSPMEGNTHAQDAFRKDSPEPGCFSGPQVQISICEIG